MVRPFVIADNGATLYQVDGKGDLWLYSSAGWTYRDSNVASITLGGDGGLFVLSESGNLDRYTAALRQHGRAGNRRALRRLIEMQRTYPPGPFIAAIEQALRYGLFDLGRLEDLVLRQVAGDFFALKAGEDDDA